jgi:hypothetical protein
MNFYFVPAEILTFIRAPTDVEVAAGSRVELPCRIAGITPDKKKPKTSIRWFRGSTYKELSIGRRIRQSELGDLIIDNVQFLDAGLYTCMASRNDEAPIRARARLTVRPRTAVKVRPSALEIVAGRPATFTCETNAHLEPESTEEEPSANFSMDKVNVTWVKDGVDLDPTSDNVGPGKKYLIELDPPTLQIPVTNELDSGTYSCKVSTALDVGTGSATLLVLGEPIINKFIAFHCFKDALRFNV